MKLKEHLNTLLPINRKERFYTGTVFPMIVCKDNFKNFHLFTQLLKDCCHDVIDANPETTNIQFFTEYSLKESLFGKSANRFHGKLKTKDTPDIIIFIEGEVNTLIGIEAKMFDCPNAAKLDEQLSKQDIVLKYIKSNLDKINNKETLIFQYALLPEKYLEKDKPAFENILTWERLLNAYKDVYTNDYFMAMLEHALCEYPDLVGKGAESFERNCEGERIAGIEVYKNYTKGDKSIKIIGRNKGKAGFIKDIAEGKWMTFKYETSTKENIPNSNWITVEEYVRMVDEK